MRGGLRPVPSFSLNLPSPERAGFTPGPVRTGGFLVHEFLSIGSAIRMGATLPPLDISVTETQHEIITLMSSERAARALLSTNTKLFSPN